MTSLIDYEGDLALAKRLLEKGSAEEIALTLRKQWHKGYERGKNMTLVKVNEVMK